MLDFLDVAEDKLVGMVRYLLSTDISSGCWFVVMTVCLVLYVSAQHIKYGCKVM